MAIPNCNLSKLDQDIEYFYHRSRPYLADIEEKEKLMMYLEDCVQYLEDECVKEVKRLRRQQQRKHNAKSHSHSKKSCHFSSAQQWFLQNMSSHTPHKLQHSANPCWSVHTFGSETTGTSIGRNSDIDVAVRLNFPNARSDKMYILQRLGKIISENDEDGQLRVHLLLQAKYPIVRVKHIWKQHLQADISIADRFCIARTKKIQDYLRLYEESCHVPIKKLLVFVKFWSKQRGLNDAYHGFLNSFGIALMLLHFMRLHTRSYKQKRKHSMAQLLMRFFHYFAYNFDARKSDIRIDWPSSNSAVPVSSSEQHLYRKQRKTLETQDNEQHSAVRILDPVNAENNVAQNVGDTQWRMIRQELVRAADIMGRLSGAGADLFEALTLSKLHVPANERMGVMRLEKEADDAQSIASVNSNGVLTVSTETSLVSSYEYSEANKSPPSDAASDGAVKKVSV